MTVAVAVVVVTSVNKMLCDIRYGPTIGGRPVASVRPMMSSPLAIRSSSAAAAGHSRLLIPAGRVSSGLKPGVSLQQIQTTTGISQSVQTHSHLKAFCPGQPG